MSEKTQLIILISDSYLDRIEQVAARLRAAGLDVEDVQKETGTVMGSIDPDRLPGLSSVEGVEAVDTSRPVHAQSRGSDIQ